MSESKIDIHQTQRQVEVGLLTLERNDLGLTARNVELIRRFCNDCLLGKTVLKRAKKRISAGRVAKYLYTLRCIAYWLGRDFDQVTQKQMEDLVRRVDGNRLEYFNARGELVPRTYTAWTRHDIKVTIKKFYKWLAGGEDYPPLVRWIDTYMEEKEIPALSVDEIERLAEYSNGPRDKAIVMMLFETGARAEEFLNIRLRNVEKRSDFFAVRVEVSKTYARTIMLYKSCSYVDEWINQHPSSGDVVSVRQSGGADPLQPPTGQVYSSEGC